MKKLSALLLFTLYACQGSPAFAGTITTEGVLVGLTLPLLAICLTVFLAWLENKLFFNEQKGTKLMPIKKGSGQKVISSNIKEIMDSYKQKGTIGTSKPANKKKALKQAIAISESSARKSAGKKKPKKK